VKAKGVKPGIYSGASNVASASIETVNLTIDSNNDGQVSAADDGVEDSSAEIIYSASSDSDSDGSPDWLDGFNFDGSSDYNSDDVGSTEGFYDVHVSIPDFIDLSTGLIEFDYDGPASSITSSSTGMILWNSIPAGASQNGGGVIRQHPLDAE
jgi:hypothetical protein